LIGKVRADALAAEEAVDPELLGVALTIPAMTARETGLHHRRHRPTLQPGFENRAHSHPYYIRVAASLSHRPVWAAALFAEGTEPARVRLCRSR
jgi:hypothetical protein